MESWPLCAIILTNDRKEKSLAGIAALQTGGCHADCDKDTGHFFAHAARKNEHQHPARVFTVCLCVIGSEGFP